MRAAIQDLVVTPTEQANRFAAFLLAHRGLVRLNTRRGAVNEIDTFEVRRVVRINVTFESLLTLAAHWPTLRDAGWVVDAQSTTMALLDLQVVFDVLPTQGHRLHYLLRRAELESHTRYFGDELDLLGFYLDTGFDIGELEFGESELWLYGHSREIDDYLLAHLRRQRPRKPRIRVSRWWQAMLTRLETHQPVGWSLLATLLVDMGYDAQLEFRRGYYRLLRSSELSTQTQHVETAVLRTGPPERERSIGLLVYKGLNSSQRNETVVDFGTGILSSGQMDAVAVVVQNAKAPKQPYAALIAVYPS